MRHEGNSLVDIYTTGIGQHDLEVGANNSISGISGFNICNVTCVVGIHDP